MAFSTINFNNTWTHHLYRRVWVTRSIFIASVPERPRVLYGVVVRPGYRTYVSKTQLTWPADERLCIPLHFCAWFRAVSVEIQNFVPRNRYRFSVRHAHVFGRTKIHAVQTPKTGNSECVSCTRPNAKSRRIAALLASRFSNRNVSTARVFRRTNPVRKPMPAPDRVNTFGFDTGISSWF